MLALRPDEPQRQEPAPEPRARRARAPARPAAGVVTTGAGVAVPFAWIGRLLGARVVYVESVTRIDRLSLSCRLIRPVASACTCSGPSSRALARGRYAERAATLDLRHARHARRSSSTGCSARSTRCPAARSSSSSAAVLVPAGARGVARLPVVRGSRRPRAARPCRRLPRGRRLGAGRARERKRPVVVPRLQRFGEAVDDHQVGFARRLAAADVSARRDGRALRAALAEAEPAGRGGRGRAAGQGPAGLPRVDLPAGDEPTTAHAQS